MSETKLSKHAQYKAQLQQLYQEWAGPEAQALEKATAGIEPQYSVIAKRHVGRKVSETTYYFSNETVARACFRFWVFRLGKQQVVLNHILDQWGLVDYDADIYM